jgi:hypothetical protein
MTYAPDQRCDPGGNLGSQMAGPGLDSAGVDGLRGVRGGSRGPAVPAALLALRLPLLLVRRRRIPGGLRDQDDAEWTVIKTKALMSRPLMDYVLQACLQVVAAYRAIRNFD